MTFTATVTRGEGNLLPTGTLTFMDGKTVLGTSSVLVEVNGVATATFVTAATQLASGNHAITAVYGGNDLFVASTSPGVTQTVLPAQTTTSFTPDTPTTSVLGGSVSLTVTIPGVARVLPSGAVTFLDGAVALGQANLTNVGGIATATLIVTTGKMSVGAHSITANFCSDANLAASGSTAFAYTVSPLTALPENVLREKKSHLEDPCRHRTAGQRSERRWAGQARQAPLGGEAGSQF